MTDKTLCAMRMAAAELSGVIADVELFDGFDDVCLATLKRVRQTIYDHAEQIKIAKLNDDYLKETHVVGLSKPEQEPFAWYRPGGDWFNGFMLHEYRGINEISDSTYTIPLYTRPLL